MTWRKYFDKMIDIVKNIEERFKLKPRLKNGAALGFVGAVIGGMFTGGASLAVGAIGGVFGFLMNDSLSMADGLLKLLDDNKEKLVKAVWDLVGSKLISELQTYIKNPENLRKFWDLLGKALMNQL